MKLVLHIGLHKTGTTSFQEACYQAAKALRTDGIIYPVAYPLGQGGTPQLLREGRVDTVLKALSREVETNPEAKILLISAEEFTNVFGETDNDVAARHFLVEIDRIFDQVEFYAVIRPDQEILYSAIREHIEGFGMVQDGRNYVQKYVTSYYRKAERINLLLGNRLNIIAYSDLIGEHFCKRLLLFMTGRIIDLKELKLNVTKRKGFKTITGAIIRLLYLNLLDEPHPYTEFIRIRHQEFLENVEIAERIDRLLEEDFRRWLTTAIDEAMANLPEGKTLEKIFEGRFRVSGDTGFSAIESNIDQLKREVAMLQDSLRRSAEILHSSKSAEEPSAP